MIDILNDKINFESGSESFVFVHPFPHVIFDNFLKLLVAKDVSNSFPDSNAEFWHKYDNPLEKKLVCND